MRDPRELSRELLLERCDDERCRGEDWCAVTHTASILGRKWHPVIIYLLLEHRRLRFSDLARSIPGISNKVLSENLEALEERGVVERELERERRGQVEYCLTPLGRELAPVIEEMERWGLRSFRSTR